MKQNPDKAILERARHFEAQALEEIFDLYSQGIYRYAIRLTGDTDIARECMSETFSRFLYALKRGSGPNDYLQAYLYRIAHNWITDYFRSKVPMQMPLNQELQTSSAEEPHNLVSVEMEKQQLWNALSLLTADQRQVIVLRFLEDFDHEMIARVMNKPIGAVKALQHRAIESLRRILTRFEEPSL
jgi:RNA polymerase sigma-70 factor (ECF subfamily)